MPDIERLRKIKRFDQLVAYLRDDLDWPIDSEDFEELTFEWEPEELGIDPKLAAKIQEIKQLRPLASNQQWGIFFVKFEPKQLPVVVMRRLLNKLVIKKRATEKSANQASWRMNDLLFVSEYGLGTERKISFAHFAEGDSANMPTLKVLDWDADDTGHKLQFVATQLSTFLRWPDKPDDDMAWRAQWAAAFTVKHRHVITTSKELAEQLATLCRNICDEATRILEIENDNGTFRKLYEAFRKGLFHELTEPSFADMFAQTITYGLFSTAVSGTVDDGERSQTYVDADRMVDMVPITNPFLREMLSQFLKVGGRKNKIDFDELGINEVVELLRDPRTNLMAVIRDFGNRGQGEDPVIHFYEHFLNAYNKKLKIQRGVFYTPQPVVSYIVRSVHELLQTEFGLADGLADTTTWGEMLKKFPGLKLPPLTDEPGELRTISPDEPFVQILDPATGTATFLVEVIDVIHHTLAAKWKQQRLTDAQQRAAWNDYVPKHLLPRLYGYELMMAPYAIAHMKIGLKLAETGYRFGTEERARIYLTNALEPWVKQLPLIGFDALAHEAAAVNEIKRHKRFTVVIGNPPYSNFGQLNRNPFILGLLDNYKRGLDEKKINLDDDFIKFVRFSQRMLDVSGIGQFGMITNNVFFDGLTHRKMRAALLQSFGRLWILNLHGSTKRLETTPDGSTDENVFDILVGVGISLFVRGGSRDEKEVHYADAWGTRESKYAALVRDSVSRTAWSELRPVLPNFFLIPKQTTGSDDYEQYENLKDVFEVFGNGIGTDRDDLFYGFDRDEVATRLKQFYCAEGIKKPFAEQYRVQDSSSYPLLSRRAATRFVESKIQRCLYRPFDIRWLYYDPKLTSRPAYDVGRHLSSNLSLLLTRQVATAQFRHVFVANTIIDRDPLSLVTRERSQAFPLYLTRTDDTLNFGQGRRLNLSAGFVRKLGLALRLSRSGEFGLPAGVTPEDIFHYAYAVFHSPSYRSCYAEFLKIDFPRLPLTGNLELFRALARHGGELTALHLLESPKLTQPITAFLGGVNLEVEKISWSRNTVWVNKAQTTGFQGVREEVWSFHIGGYQVLQKWIKDRKGRTLCKEDITHYQKIIVALAETIRLMAEIDKVINQHGGWPNAFITEPLDTSNDLGGKVVESRASKLGQQKLPFE